MDAKKLLKLIVDKPVLETLLVLIMGVSALLPFLSVKVTFVKVKYQNGLPIGKNESGTQVLSAFYSISNLADGSTSIEPLNTVILILGLVTIVALIPTFLRLLPRKSTKRIQLITDAAKSLWYVSYLSAVMIAYLVWSNGQAFEVDDPIMPISVSTTATVTYSVTYYFFIATLGLILIRNLVSDMILKKGRY